MHYKHTLTVAETGWEWNCVKQLWNHQVWPSSDHDNKLQTSNIKTELGMVHQIQM